MSIIKLNPFNNEILYESSTTSLFDLISIIQSANKAHIEWKNTSFVIRLAFLDQIINEYILKKDQIIKSESYDQGLGFKFTENSNYNIGLELLNKFRSELSLHINSEPQTNSFTQVKKYSSNGVISVVLSWNLSNRIFIEKVIPAWLAGNTVVVKVSSEAISTAHRWQEIFKAVSIPESTVQFVITNDPELKKILVTHPGIKAVAFTGQLNTAAALLKAQSILLDKQFKKNQVLTGSKNACLALEEPTEILVNQVLETFLFGQGQLVWNSTRLFILERYQNQWIEAIQNYFDLLSVAESPADNKAWGPIIKSSDCKNYDYYNQQARRDQAKIITTNFNPENKNFVKPIFTFDMSNCSELQQDQLRLPIFILSAVKYGFDIPKYANISYYGHSANIFSDKPVSSKITDQLDVGLISCNKWSIYRSDNIFAFKQSATGIQGHQIFGEFNSNVKIIS